MMNNYEQAVKYFEKEDYISALDILLNLTEENKNNPNILYFLAVVKSKMGEYDSAIPLFKEVINIKKDHIEAHYNIALCLQNQNNNNEALNYYQKVIELNPFLSEAYNNIAVIYNILGKYEEAEKAFRMAVKLKPNDLNAMSNLSNLTIDKNKSEEYKKAFELFKKGEFAGAKEIIIELLNKTPNNIHLLNSLGKIHSNLNNYEKASECFQKIIDLDNSNAEAYYSSGVCFQNLDNNDFALKQYKKATELNPEYIDAYNNLGLLYTSLKKYDEAEKFYNTALKYKPLYFNSIIKLGALKIISDDFEGALNYFNKALQISINEKNEAWKSVVYGNLGFVNFRKKRINEALKYFNIAIDINPDSILAHYNKAEALLITGQFEEGWKEYEWRQGRKDFGKRKFNKPFKPEYDLKGKKVLVFAEQGIGDALQFIRYLPMLKEKGCYIILECSKELHGLLNDFNSVDEIIERNLVEKPKIEYDYEVPLLSLPFYFKTTMENIPAKVPYLSVNKDLKKIWRKIVNDNEKTKIGIVWAGSPIHTNDRHRSIKLQQFLPLLSIEGTHFYSLQKGFQVIQAKDYQLLLTNLDENIKSFTDTSAVIENLDLLITVDTSVAHLAGALGKETWLLLPFLPDWRWLLDMDKSPWYPSIKLYRQPQIYDWNSVFNELKKDLAEFVKKKSQREASFFHTAQENISMISGSSRIISKIDSSFNSFKELVNDLSNKNDKSDGFTFELDDNILKGIDLKSNSSILNLGYASNYLKDLSNQNIDKKDTLISHERFYYESNGKDYDLIIANNILQYNLAPFHTLTELKKILRPGGKLIIVVPTFNTSEEIINKSNVLSLNPLPVWKILLKRAGFDFIEDYKDKRDRYYIFICKYSEIKINRLYLSLSSGENYGWGICSKYLKKELSHKIKIINIDEHEEIIKKGKTNGTIFHALNNSDFGGLHPVRGTKNIGYTFFEFELNEEAVKNAVNYDIILGGSSWNETKLKEKGIKNTGVLIQGIDPELFYPVEKEKKNDLFIIFSGGKFELRKGQDFVLKAIQILQQKFSDIILINAWYNMWPQTMQSMEVSRHIKYEHKGETWKNFMVNLCQINKIDGNKVFTLPITPNNKLRELYLNSDIGLFPNRCEGGTNLVLMEYMACGKPVIASFNSGHKDILTESNSLSLKYMHEFKLYDDNKQLIADWEEPDIDEIVAKLEFAYYKRDEINKIGQNAGEHMKNYTW